MKNNYPIKYALIPMIEQVGWNHGLYELERDFKIVCYIVTKCYLVKESKDYYEDGSMKMSYQVVCPYARSEFDAWIREEPNFNYYSNCINSIVTDKVFDTMEDAIEERNKKNIELKVEYGDKYCDYELLEQSIEEETDDLQLGQSTKEQTIIMCDQNNKKKHNYSLYQFINLFYNENYIVYSLSVDEYKELLDSDDLEKYNHTPLLINDKESNITKVLSEINEEKYLHKKMISDNYGSFKTPSEFGTIIYTIENYQDIIESYKVNNKVLKLIKKIK